MLALATFSERQQNLLLLLLRHRNGLTVDSLTHKLNISRNAVNQHLNNLDSNGYLEARMSNSTGGRPSKLYSLSAKGLELFPRHYALFSNLLIAWIKQRLGDDELKTCMVELGTQVAREFKPQIDALSNPTEKLTMIAHIMQELGYEASVNEQQEIIANNCVFHQLAQQQQEVCELDLSLISSLVDRPIDHRECIAKGGNCCRFAVE